MAAPSKQNPGKSMEGTANVLPMHRAKREGQQHGQEQIKN
jgi:hypothetical protein